MHRDGHYTLGTGGGVTVHSVCDDEYAETTWKAANLLRALGTLSRHRARYALSA